MTRPRGVTHLTRGPAAARDRRPQLFRHTGARTGQHARDRRRGRQPDPADRDFPTPHGTPVTGCTTATARPSPAGGLTASGRPGAARDRTARPDRGLPHAARHTGDRLHHSDGTHVTGARADGTRVT
ncbi:hypothetical protein [Streptomyces sviceus]|uniref:hypothetical protein n=1 Tax=Streptomyces sviceus TaxID=285530 RepID=UPI0036E06DA9